jgi:hypothetical protein
MNPIPFGGNMPITAFPVDGALQFVLLITIVSIFVIFGMMLWTLVNVSRVRPYVLWPFHRRRAEGPAREGTRIALKRRPEAGARHAGAVNPRLKHTPAA